MNIVRRIISKLFHIVCGVFAKFLPSQGIVLMLHWIGDEMQEGEAELFRISNDSFCALLNKLRERNTIRLEDWEKERNFYAITIDDVPECFYLNAFPVLKKACVPFTLFVNLELLNTEGYITTEQLKEISQCDYCTIGSHGIKHDYYCKLKKEAAKQDLEESKMKLEELLGTNIEMFAFPYGSFYACGLKYKHFVSDYYKYGFGTVAVPITKHRFLPKYFLPRINVTESLISKL